MLVILQRLDSCFELLNLSSDTDSGSLEMTLLKIIVVCN
jgi:hypothetical protein